MAEPTHVSRMGSQLAIVMDDNTRRIAYPTPTGMWLVTGAGGPGPGPGPGLGLFMWPFDEGTVSSEYGPRTGGTGSFHEGTDFAGGLVGGTGTPIPCVGDGVVSQAYYHANFGNMIIVDHGTLTEGTYSGKQCRSLYAHMNTATPLSVSATVTKGQTVGPIGNTGASQGAHLHLEIHITNPGDPIVWNTNNNSNPRSAVNPRTFLDEYSV